MFTFGGILDTWLLLILAWAEAIVRRSEVPLSRCSTKKVLLKISQNLQENSSIGVFFQYKFGGSNTGNFLWISRNYKNTLFYRTRLGDCLWKVFCKKHALTFFYKITMEKHREHLAKLFKFDCGWTGWQSTPQNLLKIFLPNFVNWLQSAWALRM